MHIHILYTYMYITGRYSSYKPGTMAKVQWKTAGLSQQYKCRIDVSGTGPNVSGNFSILRTKSNIALNTTSTPAEILDQCSSENWSTLACHWDPYHSIPTLVSTLKSISIKILSSARRSAPLPSQGIESNIPRTWNQFNRWVTKRFHWTAKSGSEVRTTPRRSGFTWSTAIR